MNYPGCEVEILESTMNFHLDNDCSSKQATESEGTFLAVKNSEERMTNCTEQFELNPKTFQTAVVDHTAKDDLATLSPKNKCGITSPSKFSSCKLSLSKKRLLSQNKHKLSKKVRPTSGSDDKILVEMSRDVISPEYSKATCKNIDNDSVKLDVFCSETSSPSEKMELPELLNELDSGTGYSSKQDHEINVVPLQNCSDIKNVSKGKTTNVPEILEDEGALKQENNSVPYYLKNFLHITEYVLSQKDDKKLFDEDDMTHIRNFQQLTEAGQKLYVRLFQRKHKWIRPQKIEYKEIAENILPTLEELVKAQLLHDVNDLEELEETLNLLNPLELKTLCKTLGIGPGTKGKKETIAAILKHGREHKSVFQSKFSPNITGVILKKARQVVGTCFKLTELPRRVFTRILMLFSLPSAVEDEDDACGGQQHQLVTLLLVNRGQLVFPTTTIHRETVLFETREDLIRYEVARQLETDLLSLFEGKDYEMAYKLFLNVKEIYLHYCSQMQPDKDNILPVFLRCFTAGHVYIRCLSRGVEILQKLRRYKDAVDMLQTLVDQKVYCLDYRGRWYDRIALNLDQHLKQPEKAFSVIKTALADISVRTGHRFALFSRAQKICSSSSNKKLELRLEELPEIMSVREAPKVVIKGRLFPRALPGYKTVFISMDSAESSSVGDVVIIPVEELALQHYKQEGFTQGIHGEGSTFSMLFCLLFWDIIYESKVEDVFRTPYQSYPLDLNSDQFYTHRISEIQDRLQEIKNATIEELQSKIDQTWGAHHGKVCLVNWDIFGSLESVQGLIKCLGNGLVSGICQRLAQDYRHCRSGVPDLVVWNPEICTVKFVEVKGPGDRLSPKQVMWLDYLLSLGASAEVCHVEGVGSRKLRKTET